MRRRLRSSVALIRANIVASVAIFIGSFHIALLATGALSIPAPPIPDSQPCRLDAQYKPIPGERLYLPSDLIRSAPSSGLNIIFSPISADCANPTFLLQEAIAKAKRIRAVLAFAGAREEAEANFFIKLPRGLAFTENQEIYSLTSPMPVAPLSVVRTDRAGTILEVLSYESL